LPSESIGYLQEPRLLKRNLDSTFLLGHSVEKLQLSIIPLIVYTFLFFFQFLLGLVVRFLLLPRGLDGAFFEQVEGGHDFADHEHAGYSLCMLFCYVFFPVDKVGLV
jgi:hypothetical protein